MCIHLQYSKQPHPVVDSFTITIISYLILAITYSCFATKSNAIHWYHTRNELQTNRSYWSHRNEATRRQWYKWLHAHLGTCPHPPPPHSFGKLLESSHILKHCTYILKYLMTTNPLHWLLCRTWHIRFQISRPIICSTVSTYSSRINHFIVGSVSCLISSSHLSQANCLNSLMSLSGSTNKYYLHNRYPLFILSLSTIPCLIHGTTHSTYTIWQNLAPA